MHAFATPDEFTRILGFVHFQKKKNIYVRPHVRVISFRSSHRRVTIRCAISDENSKGLRATNQSDESTNRRKTRVYVTIERKL